MVGKNDITDVNCKKDDWVLFLIFSMAASLMDPNNKKSSFLAMEVEPVTVAYQKFWKWADQRLDATLVTSPTRSIVTRRSSKLQIDRSFWKKLTRLMDSVVGEMLQAQKSQQQPTTTHSAQVGSREFYMD